jgi:predicted Zn-dependent peptidase
VPQSIQIHEYENGLVLLAENMEWLESAAFSLAVQGGCARDPAQRLGLANLTCEMVQRGCGERDSHQFVNDLENLGVDHSASVSTVHASYGGATTADKLEQALAIYADLMMRPHLPEDQLDDARQVCFQEIRALEDDLPQQVRLELRRRCYGEPFGRNSLGTFESVAEMTAADVRHHFQQTYSPRGAILSVAGKIDFARLRDVVGRLFQDWNAQPAAVFEETPVARESTHIQHESAQMHIGVAYPSVPYADPKYYQARAAVGVLSDGMSSRLFTEVRENRGLCYSIYATCQTLLDRGCIVCYAGTTTNRAQETLDVLMREVQRLPAGIYPDELTRLQARLKSALIMQQESSASRCGSMAADWYLLGRVQRLDELKQIVDNLTCDSVNAYLREHPPADFIIVTLGQSKLELPLGIS